MILLLTEKFQGKGKGLSQILVFRAEERDTNAIFDVLFAPTIKAIYAHFRKLVKMQSSNKKAKKKTLISQPRENGAWFYALFSQSFLNAFFFFRWKSIVQTVSCLVFVT